MSRSMSGGISLAAALLVAAVLAAGAMAQATATVTVQDQSGDGTAVTIPQASISGSNGWVAIHADDNGSPGPVLGQAYIPEGQSSDISVPLDQPLAASQTLYAMIHEDNPADQQYTFPDGDAPVQAGGQVVVKPFQFTLGGATTMPDTGGISPTTIALLGGSVILAAGLAASYLVRRRTA